MACSKKTNLFAGSLHACQSIIYYLNYLTIAKISKLWQRKNQQEKKVQVKKKVQKRKKNTRRHVKGEIISWEELENRTGLTGDETELLTVYLHKFERGEVHVRCSKKLKDLAEYIYETESLYIAKHGGFKLLEISSIETKLCNIRQEERERKEEEEKQVKKRVENKR